MGVRILRTGDSDEWMAILKEAWQYDFHHLPQYHRVAERHGEGIAHLFVYREGVHMIALPLLLRPDFVWKKYYKKTTELLPQDRAMSQLGLLFVWSCGGTLRCVPP